MSSELQKAKSVQTQKKLFDQFLHQRILMQKMLQYANKLPAKEVLDKFTQQSKNLELNMLAGRRGLKKHLKDLVKLQKQLFSLSETSIKVKTAPEKKEDITGEELFTIIDANFQEMLPFVKETVDRWNSRTTLIKNVKGAHSKSKAFGKTILEQVHSMLDEDTSNAKLLQKSQLKRDAYKVYGRPASDLA